jgi:hypothetical protein
MTVACDKLRVECPKTISRCSFSCTSQTCLHAAAPRSLLLQVTHDVSHLTCADFLRAPGVQTPVIVRFSTGAVLL